MSELFLKILNMSLVSSMLIVALIVLRPLLKKAPRALNCALWALVGIRLVCPFTFESFLSLIPDPEPVSKDTFAAFEAVTTDVWQIDMGSVTNIISNTLASPAGASINPMQAISLVAAFIWAVGVSVMLIISLVSYFRLKKTLSASLTTDGCVFINDNIPSPFVLGFFKPKIYIPSFLTEYEKAYVIAHENAHIKRRDYLFKPLGYLILSLHWFNPFVWVAYILLCRDIESACDQKVISKMDNEEKKNYSEVLLKLSIPSRKLRACPVAFGEVGVKDRIKGVATYKKPAFWISAVAVLLVVVFALGFLTNPVSAETEKTCRSVDDAISAAIVENNKTKMSTARFCVENYVELKTITLRDDITAYIWAYYAEFEHESDSVKRCFESYMPVKVRLKNINDTYVLVEYATGSDRGDIEWIKENFPSELYDSVLYTPGYGSDQKNAALKLAKDHFSVDTVINEFFPVFNAEVMSVSEKTIIVSPVKGESVSKNTFETVALSTRHLSPTSYEPFVGDIVRVQYMDIIDLDCDPPMLTNVFNLSLIESKVGTELPFVLYSGGEGAYYMKEPVQDKVFVYKSDEVDMWLPGTFFSINEDKRTFMMTYEVETKADTEETQSLLGDSWGVNDNSDISPYASVSVIDSTGVHHTVIDKNAEELITTSVYYVSGYVSYNGDDLVLRAKDADWIYMYFIKDGDTYVFSESKSLDYLMWYQPEHYMVNTYTNFPFKNGDMFTLAEGI